MADFFDHLFDPTISGKTALERARYKEHMRSLILEAPAVRRLPHQQDVEILIAKAWQQLPIQPGNSGYDLILCDLQIQKGVEGFRLWKSQENGLPIWRMDPLQTEEQVLESRAMGADAYCLSVQGADLASLQFLVEVGRDFGIPAILNCQSAEDLALALQVQDAPYLRFSGELLSLNLLSWEGLRGRIVMMACGLLEHPPAKQVCSLIIEEGSQL